MGRASGILMAVSSLPNEYGIGTFGKEAYEFVDFLVRTKQKYWQVLPLTTTSFGDSPYQSFSAAAGNPYYIDLDSLQKLGYLQSRDFEGISFGKNRNRVDYGLLFVNHRRLMNRAFDRFVDNIPSDFEKFCQDQKDWLDPYAEFMALKEEFGQKAYWEWPSLYRRRNEATAHEVLYLQNQMLYHKMTQYFFFTQWKKLKSYANEKGILIIGDLPIYVSRDSVEMWAQPELFKTDSKGRPLTVAGTPPDQFSSTGQYWGNPIYNWDYMKESDYKWWVWRIRMNLSMYDVIRIDHFKGFEAYWEVPFGAPDALQGIWAKGPNLDLFKEFEKQFGKLPIIAEDLGVITPGLIEMRDKTGFPGMKILQYGFDGENDSRDLPHNYVPNSIAYSGTHDNQTVRGWYETTATNRMREQADRYLSRLDDEPISEAFARSIAASVSNICIHTMQDLLNLDDLARMNVPSTVGGNWCWRIKRGDITRHTEDFLRTITEMYFRVSEKEK